MKSPRHLPVMVLTVILSLSGTKAAFAQLPRPERPNFSIESQVQSFARGDKAITDRNSQAATDRNKKDIDALAKWRIYTLSQPGGEAGLPNWVEETRRYMTLRVSRPLPFPPNLKRRTVRIGRWDYYHIVNENQVEYIKEFGKVALKYLKDVFDYASQQNKPIVMVNAGKMLVQLAQTGYEETADYCLKLLDDPSSTDVHRLYALKALGALLSIEPEDAEHQTVISDKDTREPRVVAALIAYIDRTAEEAPPSVLPAEEPAEANGESVTKLEAVYTRDPKVIGFLRREAVKALAFYPKQVMRDVNRNPTHMPGFALLKVIARDTRLSPSPGIAERTEALIGFLHMLPDDELSNLRYQCTAMNMLIIEMIAQLNYDQRIIDQVPATVAWSLVGARLKIALEDFQGEMENLPEDREPKTAENFADLAKRAFADQIERTGVEARPETTLFRDWFGQFPITEANYAADRKAAFRFRSDKDPDTRLSWPR